MIRFCDKVVHDITKRELTREYLLDFFGAENVREREVFAVYNDTGKLEGVITYNSLQNGTAIEDSINRMILQPTEEFWETASRYFEQAPHEMITVIKDEGTILGFAWNDCADNYHTLASCIKSLESCGICALQTEKYRDIQMLVITDLNELAWMCRTLFLKEGYQICVIGEKWEWFGFKSAEGYLEYSDFQKLYIYAEGNSFFREKRNVGRCFQQIEALAIEGIKELYAKKVHELIGKGISVCECRMPSVENIGFKTELEWLSIEQKANINQYINSKKSFSEKRFQCLEEIYGDNTLRTLRKMQTAFSLKHCEGLYVGSLSGNIVCKGSAKRRIYLVGPCIVDGYGCVPQETLVGELQKLVGENYQVVGLVLEAYDYRKWERQLKDIPIYTGDILLFIDVEDCFSSVNVPQIDVLGIYDDSMRKTMFSEIPIHTNAEGNRVLALAMYEQYLKGEMLRWMDCDREILQEGCILPDNAVKQIGEYIENIRACCEGVIGSIVMNCNPFTYGHRYLIEYAAKQVDLLYIFVVEEDRSIFRFEERMWMVKEGTKDIANVVVVPSGRWVLSYETFPLYFEKASKQEMVADASEDLEIFARYIAPSLGITKRFVGEEPTDKITGQYNLQMQEILGRFDIEVEIIPRKLRDGEVISASSVRRYMKDDNWEQVKRLVPDTTYQVCIRQREI